MVQTILGPDHDLAKRLSKLEQDVANLNTRDVLQNATFGPNGTTVAQAFAQLSALVSNQVTATTAHNQTSGFTLSTTASELTRATISVPAGFSRALVVAVASITAINSNSTDDSLGGYADINGSSSTLAVAQNVSAFGQGAVTGATSTVLSGLTAGSTFYVRAVAYLAAGTFASSGGNRATVDAAVTFLK